MQKWYFSEIPQSGDTGILSQQLSSLSPKWRNWWIRIATSWLMLFGFIFVGYCGPIAIVLLVLAIQIKCFHEVCINSKTLRLRVVCPGRRRIIFKYGLWFLN